MLKPWPSSYPNCTSESEESKQYVPRSCKMLQFLFKCVCSAPANWIIECVRVKLSQSYWSVKLGATGWKSCTAETPAKGNITQSAGDPAVKTLHYVDAWMHEAQGKGYFRSPWKLLCDAGSIALQWNKTSIWKKSGLWNWTLFVQMFYQNPLSRK